jgi:hypothetical protein
LLVAGAALRGVWVAAAAWEGVVFGVAGLRVGGAAALGSDAAEDGGLVGAAVGCSGLDAGCTGAAASGAGAGARRPEPAVGAGAAACEPGGDSTQPSDLLSGSSGLVGVCGACAQADAAALSPAANAIARRSLIIPSTFGQQKLPGRALWQFSEPC